jgi:hypothetical protein
VDEDASGLTFEEWDPAQSVDTSQDPAPLIINSSQLRFTLDKVIPPQLNSGEVLICTSFGVWGPKGLC